MQKLGQIIDDIDQLVKSAFIPAQQGQGGPQGQGGGQDPQMQQLLQQLPPEIAQQLQQLPPDQQMQALQQLMQGAGGQAQGGGQGASSGMPDPTQPGQGPLEGKGEVIGGPPTDLNESTISIRIRDLLDLVSGGSATKSTLKVQEHLDKNNMRQQQMQAKMKQDEEKQKQKQQAEQQAATMANSGGMMGQGGIYGGQQQQAPQM